MTPAETLDCLKAVFPPLFCIPVVPLKIGIHVDLHKALAAVNPRPSKNDIRRALAVYCEQPDYHRAIAAKRIRYGIEMEVFPDAITDKQRERALASLAEMGEEP